uniref:DUF2147 domain-containing protein n=1 Tax=uncultured Helicobacter sp. TaxID=175537 RepID=A0A650EMX4_9HELI|nr:hypothetical protein Helico5904_1900 [uncultured Helicobacter sp.]
MRKLLKYSVIVFLFGQCFAQDLVGYYMTHKGESGRQAIVEFFKKDNKYYAYGFANLDGAPPKKDIHNENPALRDRIDKTTVFIFDLVRDGSSNTYKDGRVYNFDTGKIYYAKITLKDNGLELRGSVDKMGLVGETKVWRRLSDEEIKHWLPEKPDFAPVEASIKDYQ